MIWARSRNSEDEALISQRGFFCVLRQHNLLDLITFSRSRSYSDHTLLGSCVTSWAGKHQMTSTGQGRAHCLSSAEVLYSTLPDETSSQLFVPFDDTSSFFQSITPACPASAGSCLACSRVQSARWQVTKRRGLSAQHQGGRQHRGEMLKSKVHRTGHRQFTTQL